jgi:nickel-dependent lactate racemase
MMTTAELETTVREALADMNLAGRRVLLLVPDLTRSCPLGQVFRLIHQAVGASVKRLDVMMALGTHPAMTQAQMYQRMEITPEEHRTRFAGVRLMNHAWDDPAQLTEVGRFSGGEIAELTEGRFDMEIPVTCNRAVLDYDVLLIVGPVFPHEVVGFSGGNKYIFPGISGPELLNFFHWLGAVITNRRIIGVQDTPVRRVLDRAAAMLPIERRALCMVVEKEGLAGLFHGSPETAWRQAADLSAQRHVIYSPRSYHTVLSCAPAMYDELWVGGKCMYKLEPVVADGGTLIIYAPHIHEVSVVHGRLIRELGYHVRDYFLNQWDRFSGYPWGVIAHSTHVKGDGTFVNGVEQPRVNVVLATGIPEAVCREINLGYLDPATVRTADYQGREAEGVLHVPKAGEMLYRLREG